MWWNMKENQVSTKASPKTGDLMATSASIDCVLCFHASIKTKMNRSVKCFERIFLERLSGSEVFILQLTYFNMKGESYVKR